MRKSKDFWHETSSYSIPQYLTQVQRIGKLGLLKHKIILSLNLDESIPFSDDSTYHTITLLQKLNRFISLTQQSNNPREAARLIDTDYNRSLNT